MEEGERKLCLAEPTLELTEETPLQVQMQLLEEMQDMEALEVEVELADSEETVLYSLLIVQQQKEVMVELEVMEAEVEVEGVEGALVIIAAIQQEQEVQEVLAVLGAAAEVAEMLGLMAQQVVA